MRGNEVEEFPAVRRGGDVLHFAAFQHCAGELAGGVGLGVYIQPVGAAVDVFHGCMTVDDEEAETLLIIEERAADPHELIVALFFQCQFGPNASVDEQVVAAFVVELQ